MPCHSGRRCLRSLSLIAVLACAACGPSGTPEDELRALVNATEAAAEARDTSELRALVADDYRDASGRDARTDSDWDLAADIERLDIRLARDGGDWRVVDAGRQGER